MNKIPKILTLLLFAYCFISCFCGGRKLSMDLIKDSDLIFEGQLTKVDTIQGDYLDIILTFNVKKVFKGEFQKKIMIQSSNGTCGFTPYQWKYRYLGKIYLLYVTKEKGKYVYDYCSNRVAYKELHKDDVFSEKKDKENAKIILQKYKKELLTLDSLLKIKN